MLVVGVMLLLAGGFIRLATLSEPLWLDELHTAWCVSDDFGTIAARAIQGNQSPLFFWIVFPVYQLMGETETALRLMSLISSLLLLVSLMIVATRLTRSALAGVAAVLLAAIDDSFIFYAVEARPYVAVQLAAVWQIYFFIQLIFNRRSAHGTTCKIGFAVLSLLLFYLHYTTILLVAAELICALFWLGWRFLVKDLPPMPPPAELRRIAIISSVILIGFVPGLLHLIAINRIGHDWASIAISSGYVTKMIAELLIYVGIPAIFLAATGVYGQVAAENKNLALLAVTFGCVLLPIMATFALNVTGIAVISLYRFTIASSTLSILLSGLMVGVIANRTAQIAAISLLVIASTLTNPFIVQWLADQQFPRQRNENWRQVISRVEHDSRPVFVFPNLVEDVSSGPSLKNGGDQQLEEYFRFPVSGIYAIDQTDRMVAGLPIRTWTGLTQIQLDELIAKKGAWIILRGWPEDASNVLNIVDEQANAAGVEVSVKRYFEQPLFLFFVTYRSP